MKLLAFDVGGTEIKYAVIEDALTISEKGYVPTPMDGFDSFVDQIRKIYLIHENEAEGIVMSLPDRWMLKKDTVGSAEPRSTRSRFVSA